MNDFATAGLQPHRTFLLDIEPAMAWRRRAAEKGDRIEERGLQFQERVRAMYLALARTEPERMVVLDGSAAPDAVEEQIWAALQARGTT
jgi:dTMP kinase